MEQTGTKILVRNIPFQAKPAEVRDLFRAFGELKSLRIPKKMTPGEDAHRGFGFVDFNTKSDAKVCMSFLDKGKMVSLTRIRISESIRGAVPQYAFVRTTFGAGMGCRRRRRRRITEKNRRTFSGVTIGGQEE